jgi:hypothetical protein
MKYTFLFFTVIFCTACSDSFINHSVSFDKIGACTNEATSIKMLSNISGERYELNACIDDNFDGKNYTVQRVADSIIVAFPKKTASKATFKITIDIDAKPVYKYIVLDGNVVPIVQQQ